MVARPPPARFGDRFSNYRGLWPSFKFNSCCVLFCFDRPCPCFPRELHLRPPRSHVTRQVPPGLGPRDPRSSKMSPFPLGQGLFCRTSGSITVLPPHPKPSISSWGRPKAFAEGRPRDTNPRAASVARGWRVGPEHRAQAGPLLSAPSLPIGFGGAGVGAKAGLALPPCPARQPAAEHQGGSPRSGWGRGPRKGPADAAPAPLPWPGPPRCRGAGGINQDNEAAACHAPRGH